MLALDEEQFRHERAAKIAQLKAQIDQVENGDLLQSLKLQLQLAESRPYQKPEQERRFITN